MKKRNLLFKEKLTLLKSLKKNFLKKKKINSLGLPKFFYISVVILSVILIYIISAFNQPWFTLRIPTLIKNLRRRKKLKYNDEQIIANLYYTDENDKKYTKINYMGNLEFKYKIKNENQKEVIKSIKLNDIKSNEIILCLGAFDETFDTTKRDYPILSKSMKYDCEINTMDYLDKENNFLYLYLDYEGGQGKENKNLENIHHMYFEGDVKVNYETDKEYYNNFIYNNSSYLFDLTFFAKSIAPNLIPNLELNVTDILLPGTNATDEFPTYFFIKRDPSDNIFKITYFIIGSVKEFFEEKDYFNGQLENAGFNYRRSTEIQEEIENSP
jgi:hypothetical protein